mgnify:CR=1 FL=1
MRPPALSVPCTVCEFAVSEWPRPEKLAERASRVLATRSLRRTPSLRSLVLPRCAQSPSFAALSLRCAQPVASPRHSLRSVSLSRLGREPREPVWSRSFLDVTDGRTDKRTERRGPKGPPPTHVCLVRETRLLPPKAGRLASRSAKPTLDGSSLISCSYGHRDLLSSFPKRPYFLSSG